MFINEISNCYRLAEGIDEWRGKGEGRREQREERRKKREKRAERSAKAVAETESQWDLLSVLQIELDVNVLPDFYGHLAAEILRQILRQLPYIKSHPPPPPPSLSSGILRT